MVTTMGRRAVDRLGQGKAVGVVGKADRAAERGLDIAAERPAIEPGRIGILDQPGFGDDRPGNADPYRGRTGQGRDADLILERGDEAGNPPDGAVVVAGGRGDSPAGMDSAARVDGRRFDLGAAEIDPDTKCRGHGSTSAGCVNSPSCRVHRPPERLKPRSPRELLVASIGCRFRGHRAS